MTTEIFQQITAIFNRLIHVKAGYGTGGTCCHIIRTGQHYCGAIINFRQAGGNDTDNTFVPIFVVQHDRTAFGKSFQISYNLVGFLGHGLIEIFPGFVVLIDLIGFFQSYGEILLSQQVDGLFSVLDTSGGIDARAYLEHDVADGNILFCQSAYVDNRFQTYAGITVQLFQSVESKYPVFSHDGNNVRSDTYGNQVEQWNEVMELDAITDGKCLHEFEAYAATGKVLVRIRII